MTGSSHIMGTGLFKASMTPNKAALGPTSSNTSDTSSLSETFRVLTASDNGVIAGSVSSATGKLLSGLASGTTVNFITWPVVLGSATSKSSGGSPPPNGSSGASLMR